LRSAFDVQRAGFLENAKADVVLQLVAEQLARRAVHGLQQRARGDDRHLQAQERGQLAIRRVGARETAAHGEGDGVDQQLAHPQRRGGDQRDDDAESED
jgi:hypothetical protein